MEMGKINANKMQTGNGKEDRPLTDENVDCVQECPFSVMLTAHLKMI